MPRTISRDDIAARLHAKGYSADQINALFIAFDLLKRQQAIDPQTIEMLQSVAAPVDPPRGQQENPGHA